MAEPFRILTLPEILAPPPDREGKLAFLYEFDKAYLAGAKFDFGVDETDLGYLLTINYRPMGVFLFGDLTKFRQSRRSETYALITPNQNLAGETHGILDKKFENAEFWNDLVIYVSEEEYNQLQHDANYIFNLYCDGEVCFRGIPDIWFFDLPLVKFIRERLYPDPKMGMWFIRVGGLSATPRWLTPPIRNVSHK